MKKLITICFMAAMLIVANQAMALVTVDFEAYTDAQNLNGLNLGGITLTNPTNSIVEIYDNRFGVGYHSATKAIASFGPDSPFSVNPIVGVFDAPVTYVSLWAGDGGGPDMDQWRLDAYDSVNGGNLVGSVTSEVWIGGPYTQLSISGAEIMRFEAFWLGPEYGIGFDDLSFEPSSAVIPAPGAILLGSIGVALVGWLRRRRTL